MGKFVSEILCSSTAIEDITIHCRTDQASALAFFYFEFSDDSKQKTGSLVRSLITQLLAQAPEIPQVLLDMYSSYRNGEQQPSYGDLQKILQSLLGSAKNSYVVIDALDECTERQELLDLLKETAEWNLDNLRILATSRKEKDIEDGMLDLKVMQLDVRSELIGGDIRVHVHKTLHEDSRLKSFPKDVQAKIEEALVKKAQGM